MIRVATHIFLIDLNTGFLNTGFIPTSKSRVPVTDAFTLSQR